MGIWYHANPDKLTAWVVLTLDVQTYHNQNQSLSLAIDDSLNQGIWAANRPHLTTPLLP